MTDRTITLDAELVERLEKLARTQGRSVDAVLADLLGQYKPLSGRNWVLAVAEGMEAAEIEWRDEPDASERSSEHYKRHLSERWMQSQNADSEDA